MSASNNHSRSAFDVRVAVQTESERRSARQHPRIVDRRPGGGSEARRESRYEIRVAISFDLGGRRVEATSRNVGLGGMFVDTVDPAPFGSAVTIYLPLPGFASPVAIPAVVRWRLREPTE
jgi:hypothetical protein